MNSALHSGVNLDGRRHVKRSVRLSHFQNTVKADRWFTYWAGWRGGCAPYY